MSTPQTQKTLTDIYCYSCSRLIRSSQFIAVLDREGGDINIQDNEGDTPLHHVEDLKTAKYIVEEIGSQL